MTKRTEKERVLHALRRGPVTPTDFLAPTCGGEPFLRLAARIYDLRQSGYTFAPTTKADDGTAVYRLVGEPNLARDARHKGRPTDLAGTSAGDWEAAGGHHLPTQPSPSSEQDRPAVSRVDTPDDPTPSPGVVGQLLFGDLAVDIHTSRPHWMGEMA